ncbi:sugar ABC transporter substrate-binding protein [Rhizobium sp. CG5]|uniref:polysaccharide biosynthesis/export family protein n=1 Tax=Rhizobium sp. CG5 TaxID=2726076 RepID=UPI00254FF93B|nr:polysaccharide biosynthesis/export family protein [Rhizobium sp. CG5]MCM2473500.1 sugar ABC transporter substrate-binding protein [Rhizobium sp. CG5]
MHKTASTGSNPAFRRFPQSRATLLGLSLLVCLAGPATAEDYHLGVMDKLRVRVSEWQTAEGTVRDWTAVSGDYAVGASGTLSLPFIGELAASGKTTAQMAADIGEKMQQIFGLRDRPSASVEVAEYRPVYIAGEVQTPGEYPYAPGMTVLKAVSLGGGLRRAEMGQRFTRDMIQSEGDSSLLIADRNRLLVRRARLMSEMAGKDTIEMPAALKEVPAAEDFLESERALMVSRDKKLSLQLTALSDLKTLLQNEIVSLDKKSETQNRQLGLVEVDRQKIYNLTEKGLSVSSRKLEIERQVTDLQATLLDIDTSKLRARQDVSEANQDEIKLRNDWDAQVAQELQNTESELDKIDLKLGTSRDLMAEAMMQSTEAAALKANASAAAITYTIVRDKDGKISEMPADENTKIVPGDVIKVNAAIAMQ